MSVSCSLSVWDSFCDRHLKMKLKLQLSTSHQPCEHNVVEQVQNKVIRVKQLSDQSLLKLLMQEFKWPGAIHSGSAAPSVTEKFSHRQHSCFMSCSLELHRNTEHMLQHQFPAHPVIYSCCSSIKVTAELLQPSLSSKGSTDHKRGIFSNATLQRAQQTWANTQTVSVFGSWSDCWRFPGRTINEGVKTSVLEGQKLWTREDRRGRRELISVVRSTQSVTFNRL